MTLKRKNLCSTNSINHRRERHHFYEFNLILGRTARRFSRACIWDGREKSETFLIKFEFLRQRKAANNSQQREKVSWRFGRVLIKFFGSRINHSAPTADGSERKTIVLKSFRSQSLKLQSEIIEKV